MVFTSIDFIIFFCVFYPSFLLCPHKARLPLLLAASLFFFGYAHPAHLWILLLVIGISYIGGIAIAGDPRRKTTYLVLSIGVLLGLLAYFKYADFLISVVRDISVSIGAPLPIRPLGILLPIGISFFVFQALSYIIDVYRGDKSAEKNLVVLALYKSFFPQLVAGPIERSTNLLPRLRRVFIDRGGNDLITPHAARTGCQLILYGFFKKVCIADNISVFSDHVFASPESFGAFAAYVGVLCFAIQIYCDFSGYTDIARGISRIMGVELMENFRQPYLSSSIREFWTRWHISLSTWFRDYLYKPLGGNRVSRPRWILNSLLVFLLSGLWHGAAVNFLIWGGVHGVIYIGEQVFLTRRQTLSSPSSIERWAGVRRFVAIFVTFHVVCFAWIFFRAPTFDVATAVLMTIAQPLRQVLHGVFHVDDLFRGCELFQRISFLWVGIFILFLVTVDLSIDRQWKSLLRVWSIRSLRWVIYFVAAFSIVFAGNWSGSQQFIYFQF